MTEICNKKPPGTLRVSDSDIASQVDAPIATGSAHLMRAGAELHLLHSDLELGDVRLAAVRVSSALSALAAAIGQYEKSHQVATELGFYEMFDEQLRRQGGGDFAVAGLLSEADALGLIQLDDAMVNAMAAEYAAGGDRAVFTSFIADVRAFSASLAAFGPEAVGTDPVAWQRLAWSTITAFDRLRIRGQAMAIINTFKSDQEPATV